MNSTLEVQKKTIANVKFELVEILDTKQENMQRQFDLELSRVKHKYEDAIVKVDDASSTLQTLFKRKVKGIKEKSALFFAKMEMKMKQCNDEVLKISGIFRTWQETLQGPQQKFDAQIFTLKNVVKESEKERESEFALLQDTVKKLVHALEDKVTTEMYADQAANELDTNYLLSPPDKGNSLTQRKGSQPPPITYKMNETGVSKAAISKLPAILPQLTPNGDRIIQFEIPGKIKNVNEVQGGQAQAKLFLNRLRGIKERMEDGLQPLGNSREEDRNLAPKGGKQLLKEQRKRSMDISANSTFDPSQAYLNQMHSKSSISNALTAYPFELPQTQQQSNASIVNPKTVREWAMKQDLTRTLTDGHLTSSLMKKAQENVSNQQISPIITNL